MPDEKAPSSGAFLPASLMHFLSGEPMHDLSGVDTLETENAKLKRLLADAMLDNAALKDLLSKKW